MSSEVADVLVVGAGPAGSAAALAVLRCDPQADVRLLDLTGFPRDKACGDGIAPHALAELELLGVTGVTDGYGPVRTIDLRSPGGVTLSAQPDRPLHVVPRAVFDARLVAAARAAGATFVQHRARSLRRHENHVSIDNEHAGRTLVVADGAHSTLRRQLGIPRNPDDRLAVAIRGYAAERPGDHRDPTQLITMQDDTWPAYAWSFPLADGTGRANVGYGRLRSELRSRSQLEQELERLLPGQPAKHLRAHHLPLSTWRPPQPDGRVLLVGDAASLINPLTGEGIFYAVRSGRLAGEAAVRYPANPGAAYRKSLERSLGRHLDHTARLARLSRRPQAMDAALAAARSRPRLTQQLVDIGLGDGLVPGALVVPIVSHFVRQRTIDLTRRVRASSTGRGR